MYEWFYGLMLFVDLSRVDYGHRLVRFCVCFCVRFCVRFCGLARIVRSLGVVERMGRRWADRLESWTRVIWRLAEAEMIVAHRIRIASENVFLGPVVAG